MGDLEAMRRKDPEYLRSLLWTRINQQKMLNNTLCEMMTRNSNKKSIYMIKQELNEIMEEISKINYDITRVGKKEEEVTYSFYDNVEKNRCPDAMTEKACEEDKKGKGFYDSIVKQNKAVQFKEEEDIKNGEAPTKYNYENIYKKVETKYNNNFKVNQDDLTKEFVEDLRNTADSRLQANRFLVDLKDPLSIPEIMVKSIAFDPNDNRVSVCIYDFVTDFNGKKYPILQVLKYAPNSFNFIVKHLEANGNVMYTERYSRCHLVEIYRDPIDYASDDFSKIQLFISYQNVDYETSK
jgi:hypothetical protein